MYIGDVHILTYGIFLIIGVIVGQFIDWMNTRIIENKKIFSKEITKSKIKINKFTIVLTSILYIIILYRFGIKKNLLENLDLIKFMVLIPILISIMTIDFKQKIIPNRLTFTLFESGIIFAFLYGINNLFVARNYLLGLVVGAVIFGIIAILGRLIAGKEAMGLRGCQIISSSRIIFWRSINYISSHNFFCYCWNYKLNNYEIKKEK